MVDSTYGTMYYVTDMKAAVNFYKNALGLKPGYESPEWTEFLVGDHNLCLHLKESGKEYPDNGILIMHLDGIRTTYEKMKGDGLDVFGLHEVQSDSWVFHIKDADSNELSFCGKP